jgi:hypothetical protein
MKFTVNDRFLSLTQKEYRHEVSTRYSDCPFIDELRPIRQADDCDRGHGASPNPNGSADFDSHCHFYANANLDPNSNSD